MNLKNPAYILSYTVLVAMGFALGLVLLSSATQSRIAANQQAVEMQAILSAAGMEIPEKATPGDVQALFANRMQPKTIPRGQGGLRPYTVYTAFEEGDGDRTVRCYVFPINGQGFWAPIYGYLAVKEDLVTIVGIHFYRDDETPGLGHEIRQQWFREAFKGKQYWPDDVAEAVGRQIEEIARSNVAGATGEIQKAISAAKPITFVFTPRGEDKPGYNEVDAITGASETTRALSRFVGEDVSRFLVEMAGRGVYPRVTGEKGAASPQSAG